MEDHHGIGQIHQKQNNHFKNPDNQNTPSLENSTLGGSSTRRQTSSSNLQIWLEPETEFSQLCQFCKVDQVAWRNSTDQLNQLHID